MTLPAPGPAPSLLYSFTTNNKRDSPRAYPTGRPSSPHHHRVLLVTVPTYSRASTFLSGDRSRRIFAAMLWKAFPLDSETAIAERAGPVLGLTPRHVRRLLRCEHDAKVTHFLAVATLIGVEAALTAIYGDD